MSVRFTLENGRIRRGRISHPRVIAIATVLLGLSAAVAARAQPIPSVLLRPESREAAGQAQKAAAADPANAGDLRTRQQALLDRTRRSPTDFEATYAYVDVSIQLHDNEAAIGALERLLNYDPSLARANYQLGVLYHELGSYDAAARYLRAAAASPGLDPAIRARVDALYPDTVKLQGQSRWFGFAQAGLRYQSNPTFIPPGGIVRLNGQDFLLDRQARRRADGSGFGFVQLGNDYDLQNQRGDVLETRFFAFGSVQFRASAFDFGYLEASFGPRFGLPELMEGASIKPYIVGQTSFLRAERSPYVSSGGGGVTMRLPVLETLTLEPGIEVRAIGVRGRSDVTSTFDSGQAVSGYMLSTLRLSETLDLEARVVGIRGDSARPGQSFGKAGASVALNIQFDPPSDGIARKWKLSPFVGGSFVDFDKPNAFVDPLVTRHDREFSTGLVLDAPLTATLGLSATLQYDRIGSNITNYRERNLTVLGGPTARF